MILTSPAIQEGSTIPKRFTGEGENISPALNWSRIPKGPKSYTLIMDDPDAPSGTFLHWLLFNIPGEMSGLSEAIAKKPEVSGVGLHGLNSTHKAEYTGPFPPPGKPHRYYFKLHALDCVLALPPACTLSQVQKAMQDHILDSGQLMGVYRR
jgi:Raf kinase inhibitor-like YbhB/YbcL family protein